MRVDSELRFQLREDAPRVLRRRMMRKNRLHNELLAQKLGVGGADFAHDQLRAVGMADQVSE
jgi:hypothetical protein